MIRNIILHIMLLSYQSVLGDCPRKSLENKKREAFASLKIRIVLID